MEALIVIGVLLIFGYFTAFYPDLRNSRKWKEEATIKEAQKFIDDNADINKKMNLNFEADSRNRKEVDKFYAEINRLRIHGLHSRAEELSQDERLKVLNQVSSSLDKEREELRKINLLYNNYREYLNRVNR